MSSRVKGAEISAETSTSAGPAQEICPRQALADKTRALADGSQPPIGSNRPARAGAPGAPQRRSGAPTARAPSKWLPSGSESCARAAGAEEARGCC